ncbi:Uu.00g056140.m01.CDS01 [Anthostomella pinea]|uniref:Uu.00g056140.m01.CDS01 n=1 Tax=Anthostomella pinea TaxID=933095 RepID=A0AAI8VS31_9PEZI|nr:Uu.00g056140.m01.CDS01 [Anthostomella pinea]
MAPTDRICTLPKQAGADNYAKIHDGGRSGVEGCLVFEIGPSAYDLIQAGDQELALNNKHDNEVNAVVLSRRQGGLKCNTLLQKHGDPLKGRNQTHSQSSHIGMVPQTKLPKTTSMPTTTTAERPISSANASGGWR